MEEVFLILFLFLPLFLRTFILRPYGEEVSQTLLKQVFSLPLSAHSQTFQNPTMTCAIWKQWPQKGPACQFILTNVKEQILHCCPRAICQYNKITVFCIQGYICLRLQCLFLAVRLQLCMLFLLLKYNFHHPLLILFPPPTHFLTEHIARGGKFSCTYIKCPHDFFVCLFKC